MSLETFLYGLGAIAAGAGGCIIVIREFRRRDRISIQRILNELNRDLDVEQRQHIAWRRHAYRLAEKLADRGVQPPDPPPPVIEPVVKRRHRRRNHDHNHDQP